MSPFRVQPRTFTWIVPLAFGEAALVATDRTVSEKVQENNRLRSPSHFVSRGGSVGVIGVPLSLIAIGKLSNRADLSRTGKLSAEAVVHTAILVTVLKQVTNRERPWKSSGRGDFWDGGDSFPSGHTATAWALGTVLAKRYPDKRWVRFGSYAFPTAVSLARIGGQSHFPSDVVIGAGIGYLVGRYIVQHDQ